MAAAPASTSIDAPPLLAQGTRADFPAGTERASVGVTFKETAETKSGGRVGVRYQDVGARLLGADGTIVAAPQAVEHIWLVTGATITIQFEKIPFDVNTVLFGTFARDAYTLAELTSIECRIFDVTNIPGTLFTTSMNISDAEIPATAIMLAFYRSTENAWKWSTQVTARAFKENEAAALDLIKDGGISGEADDSTNESALSSDLRLFLALEEGVTAHDPNYDEEDMSPGTIWETGAETRMRQHRKKMARDAEMNARRHADEVRYKAEADAEAAAKAAREETTTVSHDQAFITKAHFITAGISWNKNELDIDLACILTDAQLRPLDMVSCYKPVDNLGAVRHSGDVRAGNSGYRAGPGFGFDDEQIVVDLAKIGTSDDRVYGEQVAMVWFVVTSPVDSVSRATNLQFSIVEGPDATGIERLHYSLNELSLHVGGYLVARVDIQRGPEGYKGAEFLPLGICFEDCWLTDAIPEIFKAGFVEPGARVLAATRPSRVVQPAWDPLKASRHPLKPRTKPLSETAPGAAAAAHAAAHGAPADAPPMFVSSEPSRLQAVDVTHEKILYLRVHCAVGVLATTHPGSTTHFSTSDPYVVVTHMEGAKKKHHVQTRVAKKTLWPWWDQPLELKGPFHADDNLVFEVMSKDLIGHKLLGTATVGVSDIWSMHGPQILRLGGDAFHDQPAKGRIFASLQWGHHLDTLAPPAKLTAYNL